MRYYVPRRSRVTDGDAAQIERPMSLAIATPSHRHDQDPFQLAAGAVPRETKVEPLKRKLSKKEEAERTRLAQQHEAAVELYEMWIETLARKHGDKDEALAEIFNLPVEQIPARRKELLGLVRIGRAQSPVAHLLEKADLDQASRIALLRKQAYSDNPAASLKALDMVEQIVGSKGERGSFEDFLAIIKGRG